MLPDYVRVFGAGERVTAGQIAAYAFEHAAVWRRNGVVMLGRHDATTGLTYLAASHTKQ